MSNYFANKTRIVFLIIILSLTTACSSEAVSAPTETPQLPTTTPIPSTETPLPPTPLPSLTSTPTSTPTETPTYTPTESATATLTETTTPTSITQEVSSYQVIVKYLVHLGTGGNVGCGDSLVPASSGQKPTGNVVKDVEIALNSLFSTGVQYVGDLYNPLYQSNLSVQRIEYKKSSGDLVVYLSGSFTKPKENCDRLRYRAQVWQSIYQFSEVRRAIVWVNQHLLGDLLVPTNK